MRMWWPDSKAVELEKRMGARPICADSGVPNSSAIRNAEMPYCHMMNSVATGWFGKFEVIPLVFIRFLGCGHIEI